MANHQPHHTGAIGARLAMYKDWIFDVRKQIPDGLELRTCRRRTRPQGQIDELDAMTRARLLLQPACSERLFAAKVDDRFDAVSGEPADVMRRRLSGAPGILRDAMPVIINEPHKPVIYEQHFRIA